MATAHNERFFSSLFVCIRERTQDTAVSRVAGIGRYRDKYDMRENRRHRTEKRGERDERQRSHAVASSDAGHYGSFRQTSKERLKKMRIDGETRQRTDNEFKKFFNPSGCADRYFSCMKFELLSCFFLLRLLLFFALGVHVINKTCMGERMFGPFPVTKGSLRWLVYFIIFVFIVYFIQWSTFRTDCLVQSLAVE